MAPHTISLFGSVDVLPEGDAAMTLELARWSVSELPLFVLTGIATHLVVSGSQTLCHYSLGHHRLGGVFFRNHIRFHHAYYARGHLVSSAYRSDEGNNTPYFLIPTILVAAVMFYNSATRSFSCHGRCKLELILRARLF